MIRFSRKHWITLTTAVAVALSTAALAASSNITTSPLPTPTTDSPIATPTPAQKGFWDDFDPVRETWTHYAAQGVDDWALSTAYSHSPSHAYFSSDTSSIKDDYLLTRAFAVPADPQLSFWHTYQLEVGADGAVIEISTDGGTTFTDLAPNILTGSYTGQIATGWGSPISGQLAWTGGSLGVMTEVVVDLSSYAGQTAILRFRMACDSGVGGSGWYVDNVHVDSSTLPPTPTSTPTATFTPTHTPTSSTTPAPTATANGHWYDDCPPDPPTRTPWPMQPTYTPRPTLTPAPLPTCRPTATLAPNPSPTPYPTATFYPTATAYPPQPE